MLEEARDEDRTDLVIPEGVRNSQRQGNCRQVNKEFVWMISSLQKTWFAHDLS